MLIRKILYPTDLSRCAKHGLTSEKVVRLCERPVLSVKWTEEGPAREP